MPASSVVNMAVIFVHDHHNSIKDGPWEPDSLTEFDLIEFQDTIYVVVHFSSPLVFEWVYQRPKSEAMVMELLSRKFGVVIKRLL